MRAALVFSFICSAVAYLTIASASTLTGR